jgi:hypothetical protein
MIGRRRENADVLPIGTDKSGLHAAYHPQEAAANLALQCRLKGDWT